MQNWIQLFSKKMNRSRTHVFLRKILMTNSKIRTRSKYQNETYRLFQVTDSFYFFFPNLWIYFGFFIRVVEKIHTAINTRALSNRFWIIQILLRIYFYFIQELHNKKPNPISFINSVNSAKENRGKSGVTGPSSLSWSINYMKKT